MRPRLVGEIVGLLPLGARATFEEVLELTHLTPLETGLIGLGVRPQVQEHRLNDCVPCRMRAAVIRSVPNETLDEEPGNWSSSGNTFSRHSVSQCLENPDGSLVRTIRCGVLRDRILVVLIGPVPI